MRDVSGCTNFLILLFDHIIFYLILSNSFLVCGLHQRFSVETMIILMCNTYLFPFDHDFDFLLPHFVCSHFNNRYLLHGILLGFFFSLL